MSADASITLGLDAEGMFNDLKNVENHVESSMSRMAGSTNSLAAAHENLLTSNHRVARQMASFSREALSGANAGNVLAAGLGGVARSMNLSLPALAAIEVVETLTAAVARAVTEYGKLTKAQREAVNQPNPTSLSTGELHQKNAGIKAALKAGDENEDNSWGNFFLNSWRKFQNAFVGISSPSLGIGKMEATKLLPTVQEEQDAMRPKLLRQLWNNQSEEAAKADRMNAIERFKGPEWMKEEAKLLAEGAEKIKAAMGEGGELLAKPVREAMNIARQKLWDEHKAKEGNAAGLTLQEIAAQRGSSDFAKRWRGGIAQDALDEESAARDDRLGGRLKSAGIHESRALKLKEGLSDVLKPAELKSALSVAEAHLQQIEKNTAEKFAHK